MNFGKILSIGMVGIGGSGAYRVYADRRDATKQEAAGNTHTADAMRTKSIYTGVMAASLLTSGVTALVTRGKASALTKGINYATMGASLVGLGGSWAAGSGLTNARAADKELAELRTPKQRPPSSPPRSPKQLPPYQVPTQSPQHKRPQQVPTQRPPSPFDHLPVLVPGRRAGSATSVD